MSSAMSSVPAPTWESPSVISAPPVRIAVDGKVVWAKADLGSISQEKLIASVDISIFIFTGTSKPSQNVAAFCYWSFPVRFFIVGFRSYVFLFAPGFYDHNDQKQNNKNEHYLLKGGIRSADSS
jgi:hypothetical protein